MNKFLEQFEAGTAVIDLTEDSNFDENAKFVGDWLDENFDFKPFDDDKFSHYFIYVRERWPFVTCSPDKEYCPACAERSNRMQKVTRRVTLPELRKMIEELEHEDSGFDAVFE